MKVSYEWLSTFFDEKLPAPEEVEKVITFGAFEVEEAVESGDDTVLDINVLPDRASDALSHRGIAREVSVLAGIPMSRDPLRDAPPEISSEISQEIAVAVEDPERCPVYLAALVRGVTVGPSPEWLRKRLEAIGERSINNVVDATNYVMFELGQPLHAFDARKLKTENGMVGIYVRPARDGETITTLGKEEYSLTEDATVIVDAHADVPIAVAGVKGGAVAEVGEGTMDIVLEAAKFDPVRTRRVSQALKLRTESSRRFENEIPDELPLVGLQQVLKVILEIAGGDVVATAGNSVARDEQSPIEISSEKVNQMLGADLSDRQIEDLLKKLGFAHQRAGGAFTVFPPFERLDMQVPENVIEEIGRVYGYDHVPAVELPPAAAEPILNRRWFAAEQIRTALAPLGFSEVYTYSLRADGDVALANPFASDKSHLRKKLADELQEKLALNERNLPLLGVDAVRIFEIGNIFRGTGEQMHLCIGVRLSGKKREERTKELFREAQKAIETALGISLGEAHVSAEAVEWNLEPVLEDVVLSNGYPELPRVQAGAVYSSISSYPFALRDIAFWAPEGTTAGKAEELIRTHAGEWLVRCDVFDEFAKDGRVSYAFHLVFQSSEKTLSDTEVGSAMEGVEKALSEAGCDVR